MRFQKGNNPINCTLQPSCTKSAVPLQQKTKKIILWYLNGLNNIGMLWC